MVLRVIAGKSPLQQLHELQEHQCDLVRRLQQLDEPDVLPALAPAKLQLLRQLREVTQQVLILDRQLLEEQAG